MSGATRKVVVVSGPSGVGKTTVCERLLDGGDVFRSVSATTRERRGEEQDGRDYFFLSQDEFERRIAAGEFLEWAKVHGKSYYGTLAAPVRDALAAGQHVLLNIDVQGAAKLREDHGLPLVTVFLLPPPDESSPAERMAGIRTLLESPDEDGRARPADQVTAILAVVEELCARADLTPDDLGRRLTLIERLVKRGDTTPESMRLRMTTADEELAAAALYDHQVINDDLDRTKREILALLG
jgi:guanylate kinase